MTIANIILRDSAARVEVFTDTATRDLAGCEAGERSKCLVVPTLQCAVTGRGALPVVVAAWGFLWNCNVDFDTAVAALAKFGMAEAARGLRQQVSDIPWQNDVAVVGWSDAARRYRIHLLRQDGGENFTCEEVEGDALLMPWVGPPPGLERGEDVVRAARCQLDMLRADSAQNAAGGHLHRTRLLAGGQGIEIDVVHTFDSAPPDAVAAAFNSMTGAVL